MPILKLLYTSHMIDKGRNGHHFCLLSHESQGHWYTMYECGEYAWVSSILTRKATRTRPSHELIYNILKHCCCCFYPNRFALLMPCYQNYWDLKEICCFHWFTNVYSNFNWVSLSCHQCFVLRVCRDSIRCNHSIPLSKQVQVRLCTMDSGVPEDQSALFGCKSCFWAGHFRYLMLRSSNKFLTHTALFFVYRVEARGWAAWPKPWQEKSIC